MPLPSSIHTKIDKQPLPKGWRWAKLGDVCEFTYGESLPLRERNANGNIPVYGSNGIIGYHDKAVTKGKTIIVGRKGSIGEVNLSHSPCFPIDTTYYVENGKEELDSDWLFHWLKALNLSKLNKAAAVPGLNREDAYAIEIPLPPLEEQKRIAARLDEQMRHIEQARLAAEESLSAAWELPSAYLGEVFEGKEAHNWETKFIKDFAETGSGATPLRSRQDYYKNGNIPWVKTGELKDRFIEDAEEHVTEIAIKETSLRLFPANTLLIAMYGQGQTRGRTSIITKPMTTNQACFAILPNEHFDTEYLQMWFQYSYDRLRRETEGRGGNQPNLNGIVLRNQKVPLPDLDIQKQVVAKVKRELSEVRALTASLESQLAEIESLPSAVLGQAFAGQL